MLWNKYAMAHFKIVALEKHSRVYSLGPNLSQSADVFCQALHVVMEDGQTVHPPDLQFGFESEAFADTWRTGFGFDSVDSDDDTPAVEHGSVLFFVVVQRHPNLVKLPRLAAAVSGEDKIVIALADVLQLDSAARTVVVDLDGPSSQNLLLLCPETLSLEELSTMRVWDCAESLIFRTSMEFPQTLQVLAHRVISDLLSARSSSGCMVLQGDASREQKLEVLDMMFSRGLVEESRTQHDAWQLTDAGFASIKVSHSLSGGEVVLRNRSDIAVEDASTFELLNMLANQGWRGAVHGMASKGGRSAQLPPYSDGQPLVWYVKESQRTILSGYLRALLLHGKHKRPVEHFRTEGWYKALLSGESIVRSKRAKRQRFDFHREAAGPELAPPRAALGPPVGVPAPLEDGEAP